MANDKIKTGVPLTFAEVLAYNKARAIAEDTADASKFTKEQIKTALDDAGVDYPADANKAELVEIYNAQ